MIKELKVEHTQKWINEELNHKYQVSYCNRILATFITLESAEKFMCSEVCKSLIEHFNEAP